MNDFSAVSGVGFPAFHQALPPGQVLRDKSLASSPALPLDGCPMFADFRVHGLNKTLFQCSHHRSTPTNRKRKEGLPPSAQYVVSSTSEVYSVRPKPGRPGEGSVCAQVQLCENQERAQRYTALEPGECSPHPASTSAAPAATTCTAPHLRSSRSRCTSRCRWGGRIATSSSAWRHSMF